MTTHPVPTFAADMALSLYNDARSINVAQDHFTTVAKLEAGLAAIRRIRSGGAELQLVIQNQLKAARSAEAAHDHARRTMSATPVRVMG